MNENKVKFIVVSGHTLGCTIPGQLNCYTILNSSVLRGAPLFSHLDGWNFIPQDPSKVRPATIADFDTFRISSDGYRKDTEHYDFPQQ